MVNKPSIKCSSKFKKTYSNLDNSIKIKVKKQLLKISQNPSIGKPMRYSRKGTREVYIKPFRLSYIYSEMDNTIILLALYHKDNQ